nr:putative leucine-rich repeat receptor-like serine/threonine-protein kinase At2g19230 isoform X1 [Ipomoea trifida]
MELLRSFLISLLLFLCFTSSIFVLSQDPQADSNFIGDNNNAVQNTVSQYYQDRGLGRQWRNLTSFPKGIRNCYTLRPAQGKLNKYLIRASFFYGNYDGNSGKQLPQFDLHLGAEYWDAVEFDPKDDTKVVDKEIIHSPSSELIHVCLVNTGLGTPFISVLELRPLENFMYPPVSGGSSLMLNIRWDIGSTATQALRSNAAVNVQLVYEKFIGRALHLHVLFRNPTTPIVKSNPSTPTSAGNSWHLIGD